MSISCSDICEDLDRRLRAAGFDYPDDEDHEPMLEALAKCELRRIDDTAGAEPPSWLEVERLADAYDKARAELEPLDAASSQAFAKAYAYGALVYEGSGLRAKGDAKAKRLVAEYEAALEKARPAWEACRDAQTAFVSAYRRWEESGSDAT